MTETSSAVGIVIIDADIMPCHAFDVYRVYAGTAQARIRFECDAEQFSRIASFDMLEKIVVEYHGTKRSKQTCLERWTLYDVSSVEASYSQPLATMYAFANRCIGEKVGGAQPVAKGS